MKKNKQDYFDDCRTIQHITQHKRFVLRAHPNPSLTLRTSFMLGKLAEMLYVSCNDGDVKTKSKAQEAALAEIEELKKRLKKHGVYYTIGDNPYTAYTAPKYNTLEEINEVIKEYGLQDRFRCNRVHLQYSYGDKVLHQRCVFCKKVWTLNYQNIL